MSQWQHYTFPSEKGISSNLKFQVWNKIDYMPEDKNEMYIP